MVLTINIIQQKEKTISISANGMDLDHDPWIICMKLKKQ